METAQPKGLKQFMLYQDILKIMQVLMDRRAKVIFNNKQVKDQQLKI